jgi:hypothetical protein
MRQQVAWPPDFVPEGLNDRSLAVYCQGPMKKVVVSQRRFDSIERGIGSSYTVARRDAAIIPSLRDGSILGGFQAVNCQATITQVLRGLFPIRHNSCSDAQTVFNARCSIFGAISPRTSPAAPRSPRKQIATN